MPSGTTPNQPVKIDRGPSAKALLRMEWEVPTYAPEAAPLAEDESAVQEQRRALPREEALARMAGDDRRPLLVLRECLACSGTDDALLSRTEDNERTMLLSRWFRCVKLPPDVLEGDHPFSRVFADATFDAADPPHLFVARWDGSQARPLRGDQSRRQLWDAMEAVLSTEYEGDHGKALKKIFQLLDGWDRFDSEFGRTKDRFEEILEEDGPKSPKLRKVKAKLTELKEERESMRAELERLTDLGLAPSAPERTVRRAADLQTRCRSGPPS